MGASVRLAIAGCGEVTQFKHLPALSRIEGVQVIGVADPDERKRENVANLFRIPHRFARFDAMLSLPDLDAVGVCTPPDAHRDLAMAALESGRHVWVDKPLARTEEDCRAIVGAAQRSSATLFVGFHMRWHPLVLRAREAVRSGVLGPIETIRSTWFSPRSDAGLPSWRWRRESGGGAFLEIGVHQFDLWRFLLGSEVEEVFARSRDGSRDDEAATVSARLANGVLAATVLSERTAHEIEIEICGREGRVRVDCLRFEGFELLLHPYRPGSVTTRLRGYREFAASLPRGIASMRRGGDYRDSYRLAWAHFCECVRGREAPGSTVEDGLRATEIANAALRSRASGQPECVVRFSRAAGDAGFPSSAVPPPCNASQRLASPGAPERSPGIPSPAVAPASELPERRAQAVGILFSVVVPTYNRPLQLASLLEALAAQRFPKERFEVIVVDDGGGLPLDGMAAPFAARLQLALLRQANAGCAAARQHGVLAARGRWLAFTDDDCRPAPDWLSRLQAAFSENPDCAAGGVTINGCGRNAYSEASQTLLAYLDKHLNGSNGWGRYYPTSNIAFPAAGFQAAGGLDPTWRVAGGEDRDLCRRWIASGRRIVPCPDAVVYHYHDLDLTAFCRQHFDYGRGALLYRTAQERKPRMPFEPMRFYAGMPLFPFARFPLRQAAPIAALLALSQFATAAGFACEAVRHVFREPARAGRHVFTWMRWRKTA